LQIEDLVEQCPGVNEAAVIGTPDAKWGERPLAFVVADADHAGGLNETDIKAHLQAFAARGVISKIGIPEKVRFVDRLTKTSVGKVDKKILRQTFATAP